MSYCRFSSDWFRCDVYAFEDVMGGVTVHVAQNRPVFNEATPPTPDFPSDGTDDDKRAWVKAHADFMSWLRTAKREPIGLSRDGDHYWSIDYPEALALLESLRDEGYVVPPAAIEELRDDCQHPERWERDTEFL